MSAILARLRSPGDQMRDMYTADFDGSGIQLGDGRATKW
jgi:hypothetical protein